MTEHTRWQQIEALCDTALGVAEAERDGWLMAACAGDENLLAEVRSLMAQAKRADTFLTSGAFQQVVAQAFSAHVPEMVGRRLGPYEITGFIGAGGMGEVYRAQDTRLARTVAVKLLPSHATANAEQRRRFAAEARAAGALSHPNVMAVYDVGEENGTPYIVAELLDGETLRAKMRSGPLGQRRAIDYAVQMAHGLAAAHEARLVHRDFKPENVFVTVDGRIKILDFGIAKQVAASQPRPMAGATETVTDAAVVMGTASYMSPEQVRGELVDHRTDIFAFGAVLYEMLSGARAFARSSFVETMAAVANEEVPELAGTGRRSVTPALEQIVRRCLEKEPRLRFQSATDLAYALELVTADARSGTGLSRGRTAGVIREYRKTLFALVAGVAAGALAAAYALTGNSIAPTFTRASPRYGLIGAARFLPGSSEILYAASVDGGSPTTLYRERGDGTAPQPLAIAISDYFGISDTGQLAFRPLNSRRLATLPLTGGAPHDIANSVSDADWAPDGNEFAITRREHGKTIVEYPIGSSIFETSDDIGSLRVSRHGDAVAFIEYPFPGDDQGFVVVVDRQRGRRVLTKTWIGTEGLAWSADDREIWFTATDSSDDARAVYAVTRSGKERLVLRTLGGMALSDIAVDGRVILDRSDREIQSVAHLPDGTIRKLSWQSIMLPKAVSRDGSRVVIDDWSSPTYRSFLVPTDGSAAMLLGDGAATDMSPDGAWVSAIPGDDRILRLLPVGIGQPRSLTAPGLHYKDAKWSADARSLLITARRENGAQQYWIQDSRTGTISPLRTPASDGRFVRVQGRDYLLTTPVDGAPELIDIASGARTTPRGIEPTDDVVGGSSVQNALIAVGPGTAPGTWIVRRIDLRDGTRTESARIAPTGSGRALYSTRWAVPLDDGRGLIVTEQYLQSTLYIARGLK